MAVTINKTDGTILTTINDGVVDTTSVNLALIGRLYRNYGELINENFVKLLENFANSTSPSIPIQGQLWYDTTNKTLKIYRTTGFVPLGCMTAANAQPNNPTIGDLWFDTIDQQLKIYNNTWIVIGPSYTTSQGKTGIFTETVRDTTNGTRLIISSYVNGAVVAIHSYSADTWIPQNAISGFTNIQPGINLSVLNNQRFVGTATNSLAIGGIDSSKVLRNDQNGIINGNLTITANSGITVGSINSKIYTEGSDILISNLVGNTEFLNLGNKVAEITANTKQILASNGNVTNPGFSFIDNPTSGISHTGNGNISISSNGSAIASFSALSTVIGSSNTSLGGNISLGDTTVNTVTINTNKVSAPNGLIITTPTVSVSNAISISGSATIFNSASVAGNLGVGGNINVNGNASVIGNVNVSGNVTLLEPFYTVNAFNTAKYWICFDGRTSNLAIREGYNIISLTKTGTNTFNLILETPINSNALCGVGSNGGRITTTPSVGATTISITTLSETDLMGFVIFSE